MASYECLEMIGFVPWFIVHMLILNMHVKYGQPVEDDKTKILQRKLEELFATKY